MRWLAALLLVAAPALIALPAAPAGAEPPACPLPGQTAMLVVRLYFGQSIKGRGLVSRRAWQRFVADTITPALPDGFTVYDANGQYVDQQTHAIGREPTEVVEVAAEDTEEFRLRIASVMDAYRRRFDQGAVGVVSHAACGGF
jgi:hypothetical protein